MLWNYPVHRNDEMFIKLFFKRRFVGNRYLPAGNCLYITECQQYPIKAKSGVRVLQGKLDTSFYRRSFSASKLSILNVLVRRQ
jgi:hypothetical protein